MNKLSPIVSEFETEEQEQAYLHWLEAKIEAARADSRPRLAHDSVMAEIREILAAKSGATA